MSIFGEIEEFLSEDVYPYRWFVLAVFLAAIVVAGAVTYRLGWHLFVWRHRLLASVAVVVFLAAAVPIGYPLVSPLFNRVTVCEASPIAGAGAGSEKCAGAAVAATGTPGTGAAPGGSPSAASEPAEPPGFQPHVTHRGEFRGADEFHFGRGNALLIKTEPEQYVLRFEEFSVRNGPDLFVYLSPDPSGFGDGALNLGELKGTDGAFNYVIPPGTDISQFRSALVWCRQFSVLFAVAPLVPAPST